MGSGGHARSGPAASPTSARSDQRGLTFKTLPAEGYSGSAPEWPLVPGATKTELHYWEQAWKTPQAQAWSLLEYGWMLPQVARWVRVAVRCDQLDSGAALFAQLRGLADEIGMTPGGLARLGWIVAADAVSEKRSAPAVAPRSSARTRMTVVPSAGAGV